MAMRDRIANSGHKVSVVRVDTGTLVNGRPGQKRSTLYAELCVLLEPTSPTVRETPLGSLSQSKWRMSWRTAPLRHGDQVTVICGPRSAVGEVFVLRQIDDNSEQIRMDPYSVGFLFQGDQS